jgi:hypothetical protein
MITEEASPLETPQGQKLNLFVEGRCLRLTSIDSVTSMACSGHQDTFPRQGYYANT